MTTENKALTTISKNQALYLLQTIWPEAPTNEQVKAALICQQYQLNPLMRQVYLIKFGKEWVTVLGIKASRQIAQQKHRFSYVDGPRVMNEDEQKKILGEPEPGRIWAITILKDSDGNLYPGYGFWPKDSQPYGQDKGNSARNMAFIRSERNALDKMAPGELPDIEATDETYSPIGNIQIAVQEGKKEFDQQVERDINDVYGERPPDAPEAPKKPVEAKVVPETPAAPVSPPENKANKKRDLASIKNIEQLAKALKEDFGLSYADQWKELNIKRWTDLAISPGDAYRQIAATREP